MSVIEISESRGFPSVLNVKRGPELRRYVPERTCRNVSERPGEFECSECGATLYGGDETGFWIDNGDLSYCPNCGARVVSE